MCGIAGYFNPGGLAKKYIDKEKKDASIIKQMARSMHHRGPEEKGVLYSNTACLGHARLSIVDIATGQQPMLSADNQLAITFNGEIYNFIELRAELEKEGVRFRTRSDTEVLIQLYRAYGPGMLDKLNGQFAFGIVDYKTNTLFLARDRIGIRPLYYSVVNGTIVFSSSLKTIRLFPGIDSCFDFKAYSQLLHFWAPYGETTFFKGINSLCPGQYLEFGPGGMSKTIYWDLSFEPATEQPLEKWTEQVYNQMEQAVSIRLRADVPVNAYLSGGLDSTIILGMLKQLHKNQVESFSIGFSEAGYDESEFQKIAAVDSGLKNHPVLVKPEDIGRAFSDVIYHCEQPIYRTAPAPLYYLSQLVRENDYKVVLTGEGADEIAWGYNIFKETMVRHHLAQDPDNQEWLGKIPALYPYLDQFNKKYMAFLTGFYKQSLSDSDSPLFSHQVRMKNGQSVIKFLHPDVKEEVSKFNVTEEVIASLPEAFHSWEPLQKAQYLEMKTLLAGYLLSSQGDRMAMAHSVEGRYPFLDHNVVELFTRMPGNLKLNDMNEKYILKESFKHIVPSKIIQRNKQPYRAPEAVSLLDDPGIDAFVTEEYIEKQGFFNWKTVARLKKKLTANRHSINFNDNFAYVNIAATTVFKSQTENNGDILTRYNGDMGDMDFNEIDLREK